MLAGTAPGAARGGPVTRRSRRWPSASAASASGRTCWSARSSSAQSAPCAQQPTGRHRARAYASRTRAPIGKHRARWIAGGVPPSSAHVKLWSVRRHGTVRGTTAGGGELRTSAWSLLARQAARERTRPAKKKLQLRYAPQGCWSYYLLKALRSMIVETFPVADTANLRAMNAHAVAMATGWARQFARLPV